MKRIMFILCVVIASPLLHAFGQNSEGQVIAAIANSIKEKAFTSSFIKAREAWVDKANQLKAGDIAGSTDLTVDLVNGLKTSAFASEAKGLRKDLIVGLLGANDTAALGRQLHNLVNGLNPSVFKPEVEVSGESGLLQLIETLN